MMQLRSLHSHPDVGQDLGRVNVDSRSVGDEVCTWNPQTRSAAIHDSKKILIATPLKDAVNMLSPFATALANLSYPKSLLSVAFLVSDSHDATASTAEKMGARVLSDFHNVSV